MRFNPLLSYRQRMNDNPTRHEEQMERLVAKLGTRYRFQHIVGQYIADFMLPDLRLIIEVDGVSGHSTEADIAKDAARTQKLGEKGWQIYRVTNTQLDESPAQVLRNLKKFIKELQ